MADGRVVSGSWDKTLRVWTVPAVGAPPNDNVQPTHTLKGHTAFVVNCVTTLADGRVVSGGGKDVYNISRTLGRIGNVKVDNTLRVWTVPDVGAPPNDSVHPTHTLKGHTDDVNCVTTLADGRVVSGSYDSTLHARGV